MQDFFYLSQPNVRNVLLGTILLSTSSAMIGTFALLKKKSLISDAVAHSVLPGTCLAFFFTGTKDSIWLIISAFITGWLASIAIDKIISDSKIKQDTAIATVGSVTFGVGTLLLSILQHTSQANQGGLKSLLLGSAATLLRADVVLLLWLSLMIILILCLFFKEFMITAFDPLFAKSIGIPVKKIDFLFTSLMVLAIVIGIRTVGVVLMSAMLLTPATTARFWSTNIVHIMLLAVLIALLSSLTGTYISYMIAAMPTGPWIVLIMSFIAYCSFCIARYVRICKKNQ